MEIKTLFGLPAHPMLVHSVVVLVPLVALGIVLGALWRPARRALAPATLALAAVTVLLIPFVTGSGEQLEEEVDRSALVRTHVRLGDGFLLFGAMLGLGAAIVAVRWWFERDGTRPPAWLGDRRVLVASVVAAIVLGMVPTYRVIQIGHSGAKATWDDVDDAATGD